MTMFFSCPQRFSWLLRIKKVKRKKIFNTCNNLRGWIGKTPNSCPEIRK